MIAAARGHVEVVEALLAKGANVNATTKEERITPLMFAAVFGNLPVVQVPVEKGRADIGLKEKSNRRRALEWAAVRGSMPWAAPGTKEQEDSKSTAIMKYFVSKGAVVQKVNIIDSIIVFGTAPDLSGLFSDFHQSECNLSPEAVAAPA